MDELHYVSTIPYNEEMVERNLSCGNQYAQVIRSETVANTLSQEDRIRAQKREWIRKKRANKEFRDKENKAKQNKRSANIEKIRESQRQTFKKQKESNPTHVRDLNRKAFLKTKEKKTLNMSES